MTVVDSSVLLKSGHVMRSEPPKAAIPSSGGKSRAIFFWDHKSPQKGLIVLNVRLRPTQSIIRTHDSFSSQVRYIFKTSK
jgi:hypothetical protein